MKKKLFSMCLLILMFSAEPLFRTTYAQNAYTLRFKFEKGKACSYKSGMHISMTQQMMGNEMTIVSDFNNFIKFETKDILDNGNFELITYLDSGTVKSSLPGKDTTIVLNDFIGKRIKLITSPNGEVVSRVIVDSVPANNIYYTGKEMIEIPVFPVIEIKIGELWSDARTDTVGVMGGKMMKLDSTQYKITGIENKLGYDCLVIEFNTRSTMEGKGSMSGMDFIMEGTGISSGKNYFAPAEGVFVHSQSETESDLSMAASGQQNFIIPINQKLTSEISLIGIK